MIHHLHKNINYFDKNQYLDLAFRKYFLNVFPIENDIFYCTLQTVITITVNVHLKKNILEKCVSMK